METKNKILLVEKDKKSAFDICLILKNSGYEITDVVPFIHNVVGSIDRTVPDVIMLDVPLNEQIAEFISDYIKLPIIIITNLLEKEIYRFPDKIKVLSIISIPFNSDTIRTSTAMAFNKINKSKII
jgi:AmiR/NasT family two-component response regulator